MTDDYICCNIPSKEKENEIKFKDKLQLKKFPVIKILSNVSVDSNEGIIELPNTETIDFLTKSNGNFNLIEKIERLNKSNIKFIY